MIGPSDARTQLNSRIYGDEVLSSRRYRAGARLFPPIPPHVSQTSHHSYTCTCMDGLYALSVRAQHRPHIYCMGLLRAAAVYRYGYNLSVETMTLKEARFFRLSTYIVRHD